MIRISKKADYAVLIMAELAMRGQEQDVTPPTSAQEIADCAGLSKPLAANLMKALTRASLLESVRGINGGYRLAKPMQEITLTHILEAVEGPMVLVDCASDSAQHNCDLSSHCPSRTAMRGVHERIAKLVEQITLPELLVMESRVSGAQPFAASSFGGDLKS